MIPTPYICPSLQDRRLPPPATYGIPLQGGSRAWYADSLVFLRKSKEKQACKLACHCLVHVCTTWCCQMQHVDLFCCRPSMNGDTPPMGKQSLACRFLSFLEESQGKQTKSEHGSLHVTVWCVSALSGAVKCIILLQAQDEC